MAGRNIHLRIARPEDAVAMGSVDERCWPPALATTANEFAARIAVFPPGQLIAEAGGRMIATAAAQRITAAFFEANGHDFDALTDSNRLQRSHSPAGKTFQLISVGVVPEFRGFGLARRMVDRQIELARSLDGVERIIGWTRPSGYHRRPDLGIDDYVHLRNKRGRRLDAVVEFHVSAGAQVIAVQAGFRPADVESRGFGVLIEYPIEGPPAQES